MDKEALFRAIYDDHKKGVYNLALHYVLHPEDAQDITQEVFVKVYQHYAKHDPSTASLKTWIYRICINHCLDFLRRKKAGKRRGFIQSLFQRNDSEPLSVPALQHPGIAAEDKEELHQLLAMINELPDNQRTALILLKIEDKSQKETAEIMQTSTKAVESLLQRAKQNLEKKWRSGKGLP